LDDNARLGSREREEEEEEEQEVDVEIEMEAERQREKEEAKAHHNGQRREEKQHGVDDLLSVETTARGEADDCADTFGNDDHSRGRGSGISRSSSNNNDDETTSNDNNNDNDDDDDHDDGGDSSSSSSSTAGVHAGTRSRADALVPELEITDVVFASLPLGLRLQHLDVTPLVHPLSRLAFTIRVDEVRV
jgi:hypothetical protein